MYETDNFVKVKFRFISKHIFITNEAQIVITLSHTKRTQTYIQSMEVNFFDVIWRKTHHLSTLFYMLSVLTTCTLIDKFLLSEFSTPKEHRCDSYFDHRTYIYVCRLWKLTFWRQFHELLVTLHCQSRHERHLYSAAISEMLSSFKKTIL
jgi:hypothetical protein